MVDTRRGSNEYFVPKIFVCFVTDVPKCPAGARKMTVGNVTSCYTFHVTPKSWSEAVKVCKAEAPNAHLISVNSKKEQDFISDTIQSDAS
jgi:hypothetical protein